MHKWKISSIGAKCDLCGAISNDDNPKPYEAIRNCMGGFPLLAVRWNESDMAWWVKKGGFIMTCEEAQLYKVILE